MEGIGIEVAEESIGVGYKEVVIGTDEMTADKTEVGENEKGAYEDVDRLI